MYGPIIPNIVRLYTHIYINFSIIATMLFVTGSNWIRYGKSKTEVIYPQRHCASNAEQKAEAQAKPAQNYGYNFLIIICSVLSPLSHCSIRYVKLRRFGSYYSLINIVASSIECTLYTQWERWEKKLSENNTRAFASHMCVPSIINADSSYNLTFTYAQTHQTKRYKHAHLARSERARETESSV